MASHHDSTAIPAARTTRSRLSITAMMLSLSFVTTAAPASVVTRRKRSPATTKALSTTGTTACIPCAYGVRALPAPDLTVRPPAACSPAVGGLGCDPDGYSWRRRRFFDGASAEGSRSGSPPPLCSAEVFQPLFS